MAGGLAVASYLLVPLVLMAFNTVRAVILLPIREMEWADQPRGKRLVFTTIIFVGAIVAWPLFIRAWFSSRERTRAEILDWRKRWPTGEAPINEVRSEADPVRPGGDSTVDEGIPITKTGLVSDLGGYAESGELFLTTRITGAEADRIREAMRVEFSPANRARVARALGLSPVRPPPISFEPLPTDEVWEYTTSIKSWQHLAGRAGHALVRDGVVICNSTTWIS